MQPSDEKDFTWMYENYYRRMCDRAYRKVGSWQDAEDIIQEAFYRFAKQMPSFQPKSPASCYCWLITTIDNLCIDYYRGQQKVKHTYSLEDERDESTLVLSLLEIRSYKEYCMNELIEERNTLLYEALAVLTPFHRNLLTWHYVLGYQVNEVVALNKITRQRYQIYKSRSFDIMRKYLLLE